MAGKGFNGKNNILVCGALAYDRIMDFPGKFSEHILAGKTHILNLSFTVGGVKESFGGTGGNIAYNLSLLGERPNLIAAAGKDFSKYKTWLKKNKVDISRVKIVKDELTASAYIMTDRADNQITAYYPGTNGKIPLTPFVKGGYNPPYPPFKGRNNSPNPPFKGRNNPPNPLYQGGQMAIIAPDLVARMVEYAKIFRQFKMSYIFDPGQQIIAYSARELQYALAGAKALVGNDYEIELVLNKLKIKSPRLKKLVEILVITKGGHGSEVYYQGKKIIIRPAKAKIVLDPTGAGDAYRAGFIKGLVMGWPLKKCGQLASLVAVYAVEREGAQAHRFSWRELEKRYEENYKEILNPND